MTEPGARAAVSGLQTDAILSWGRNLRASHTAYAPSWPDELPGMISRAGAQASGHGMLAAGLGRSYGDSGLNPDGVLLLTRGLDRIIAFDPQTRRLRAEAGVSLDEVLRLVVPHGLFVPVTPGTRFVTLGGAVANDVHGKNHHGAGTFGRWVRAIGLLRSDGQSMVLTPDDSPAGLFAATVGGLGLTGLITWVELELIPIANDVMQVRHDVFANLGDFFQLAASAEAEGWDYTVAWVDCLAGGSALGRGIFSRGRHAPAGSHSPRAHASGQRLRLPVDAPTWLLNRHSVAAFNAVYLARARFSTGREIEMPYAPFFYPLDAIGDWNRLYGKRGFYQYQCVVPPEAAVGAIGELLETIAAAGEGSFLAILKTFGTLQSPGMLSFPMPGATLALDFADRGEATLRLLDRLDAIVRAAAGRLYPAKDGRMTADMFRRGYPNWQAFAGWMDPGFSSAFWRRVAA